MNKLLVIITREFDEFDCYWKGDVMECGRFKSVSDFGLLVLNHLKLVDKTEGLALDLDSVDWFSECIPHLTDADIDFESIGETRLLRHGVKVSVDSLPNCNHHKEYSSTKTELCTPDGQNFTCEDVRGEKPLDQLRYAFLHDHKEGFIQHFEEVWQWIKPDEELPLNDYLNLLHSCLGYEKPNENGEFGWKDTIGSAKTHFTNETQHKAWAKFEEKPNIDNLRVLRDELLGS